MSEAQKQPHLAALVQKGEAQSEAVAISDFIFMVNDMSNAYLITTADGDVMVNTGFLTTGERNKALFAPHRSGPLKAIILTQHHVDHFGGLNSFKEPSTQVIVQARFMENLHVTQSMQPFFGSRTKKLWASTVDFSSLPPEPPTVKPDVIVDREYSFEQGGRRFEVIWTPDGETTDTLTVWMPNEKIAFTGNLLGPVFLSMPNLMTVRGDKPRLVRDYLLSLDRLRNLGAEILITGHGEPIRGAERIRADLDKMHAAVTWLRDYTLAGMRAGKDVHTLMREVAIPDELKIGEFHGKASWNVRAIWEEYSSWFHYDSTTSLYGVPRSSIDADLVELAGGVAALVTRAKSKVEAGKPLEAIHLLDIALAVEPGQVDGLKAKKAALEQLLSACGFSNLSETMWLRSEIEAADAALASSAQ